MKTGFCHIILLGMLFAVPASFADSQWIICPPGQALVKVPNQARLALDGTFQLEFACVPAPTNGVLATTNETWVPGLNINMSVQPDPTWDSGGLIEAVNCSIENDLLTNRTPTTQLACDPAYNGVPDITNLASIQPPDPPPGTNASSRTRAATSLQQAVMACLVNATNFTSPEFLNALGISDQVKQWFAQYYRGDLQGLTRFNRPLVQILEVNSPSFMALFPESNSHVITFRTGASASGNGDLPPLSLGFDCSVTLGDYAGLIANWMIGCTQGFGNYAFSSWPTAVDPAVNNGLSAWVAYLLEGKPEVYKYAAYTLRVVGGRPCSTVNYPDCFKGNNIRSVMMYDESNTTMDGIFPLSLPGNLSNYDATTGWDAAGLYFSAIFYDISQDAGLGDAKANLLFWKTIAVQTNCPCNMRCYGNTIVQAANALWPDTNNPGRSIYDAQIKDVLHSRGIPIGSETNFVQNLPRAIGPGRKTTGTANSLANFGSVHPETHPSVANYNTLTYYENSYTQTNAATNDYMVYQFYKYSTYGPCDHLVISDGTFTDTGTNFYKNDGFITYYSNNTYYADLQDRQLRNLLLMVPGPTIDWARIKFRCPDEHTGYYIEDGRPFGFRVIKGVKNGFVWKTTRLATNDTTVSYQFDIVDPSTDTLGAATYTFTFSDPTGAQTNLSGASVQYAAKRNEPLDILVTRVRGGETNTIQLSEPSSGLDQPDRPHYLVGLKTADSSLNDSDRPHYFNVIPSAAQLTGFSRATNGTFTLKFTGTGGTAYQVWASTNLVNWQQLGTGTELTPRSYQFVDSTVTNLQQRFYRVKTP